MPQVLKEDVRDRLMMAAAEVFAEWGYKDTRLADIAARAGISVGNIYKYAADKSDLFDRVVPVDLVQRHHALLRQRVAEFERRTDWTQLDADGSAPADALLEFWAAHRHAVAILMCNAASTRFEGSRTEMVNDMTALALGSMPETKDAHSPQLQFVVRQVFERTLDTLAAILLTHSDRSTIAESVGHFWRFQLAGLAALLTAPTSQQTTPNGPDEGRDHSRQCQIARQERKS